jgi:4-hydroxybenzoate polyprenyltransferase
VAADGKIIAAFRLVKFEHTVFALPFALAAAFLAAGGVPPALPIALIVLACVFARTAAMSFNRFTDASLDAENPRTVNREIPRGKLTRGFALILTLASAAAFVATCAFINTTVLALSPVALVVVLGYSYTKRFTAMTHLALGLALGLAPLGAWLALGREITAVPILLGCAVLLWTAGFDIIYACQDVAFDRSKGLRSLPASLGIGGALLVSRVMHVVMLGCLVAVWLLAGGLGWPYLAGVAAAAVLLVYEHSLVKPSDLSKVNTAFFTMNGLVSVLFMAGAMLGVLVGGGG